MAIEVVTSNLGTGAPGKWSNTVVEAEVHPYMGGTQMVIRFSNGYGASVIRNEFSYGGSEGLFELAVLAKGSGDVCTDTSVTNDVEGWLTPVDVVDLLKEIAAL